MDFGSLFTSTTGRINRAKWWIGAIIVGIIGAILGWILQLQPWIVVVVQLILFYPAYAVHAKRFQDRGRQGVLGLILPAWNLLGGLLIALGLAVVDQGLAGLYLVWSVILLAIGVWYFVDLGCLKGADGANQYGADPLGAVA